MAQTITFLVAVNETLKRASVIQGSSGELTTFTDTARQTEVDMMLSSWNDVIDQLYSTPGIVRENLAEGSVTIGVGVEYAVPSDFVSMAGNPINEANSHELMPYPGGFVAMDKARPDPDDFQGLPSFWVLSGINGNFVIDVTPTASESGDVYKFLYKKAINLTATGDTFPFDDEVVRALQDAVWQTWVLRRKSREDFLETVFQASFARAASMVRSGPVMVGYGARRAAR